MAVRRHSSTTELDVSDVSSVAPTAQTVRYARKIGLALGTGRLAMGGAFLAYPVASVRLLGLDSATASRVAWLARMAAVRDAALGAGTVASTAASRGQSAWLLAGAFTDAADAAVIALAVRAGRLGRGRGYLIAAGAVGTALVGLGSAAGLLRRSS